MKIRFALVATIVLCACGGGQQTGTQFPVDPNPPVILPVDTFTQSFMLRQHVTARYRNREDGFDAVLQKRMGELTLVGLGPMGTVGFAVTLTDAGITLRNDSGRDVPFEPSYILADVQRVFYPWLDGAAPDDGSRDGIHDDLAVTERYAGGRLVERRFTRIAEPERGDVVITYEGWTAENPIAPARVVLVNGWYGYTLEIDTFDVTLDVERAE